MKRALGILLSVLLVATTACGVQENEVQTSSTNSGQETAQSDSSSISSEAFPAEPAEAPVTSEEPASEFYDKVVTIPKEYTVEAYSNGYFIATKSDGRLYGLLDSQGKTVIDFTYDELTFDRNGAEKCPFVYADYDGKSGVVDLSGKVLINLEYERLDRFFDKNVISAEKQTPGAGVDFLTKKGEIIGTFDPANTLPNSQICRLSSHTDDSFCCVSLEPSGEVDAVLFDWEGKELARVKTPYQAITVEGKGTIIDLISAQKLDLEQGPFIKVENKSPTLGLPGNSQESLVLDFAGNSHPELTLNLFSTSSDLAESGQIAFATVGLDGVLVNRFINPKTQEILPMDPSIEYQNYGKFQDGKAFATIQNKDDGLFHLVLINEKAEPIKELFSFDPTWVSGSEHPKFIGDKALCFSNDTWKMISLDESYKNDMRYYRINKLGINEDWWLLENADGENALLSPNGEIVVDFGNITNDSFLGKPVLEHVISDEACCFIIEGETENEVYVVKNQAKA